jgi:hypothetical protein
MLRVSQLAALTLACAATVAPATAAPCPERSRGTLDEWQCYGEVVYTSRIEGEEPFGARFVLFANGERLAEQRLPAKVKAMLFGKEYRLFRGLEREDSTNIGNHYPFLFFEFALITPLVALLASERAPSELPDGTTPVLYTVESKPIELLREIGIRKVHGSIDRAGSEYRFEAESTGNVATGLLVISVSGHWSSEPPGPYPDSMPLEGWQYHCTPTGVDVRGNHRPVPAGVTLGDVRRGWQGPCG